MDLDTIWNNLSVGNEKIRIFNLMKVLGFNSIHVNYSGGGDSGGPDGCDFYPEPSSDETRAASNFIWNTFEETLSNPIYDIHGSFADGGGYSVNGTVIWDADEKSVNIKGTHHYYDYDDEGETTEENDEDWAETVYEYDEEDEREGSPAYDCLFAYAKFVLVGKFPGEYHNRMVASAMEGDADAIKYVKWCEQCCKV